VAKEYPEYRRSVPIQPAASPSGEEQAVAGFKQGYDVVAADSAQFASTMASERAKIEGEQLARERPGMQFQPFTQTDKAFVNAYNKQSAMLLDNQATSALNNIAIEFGRIPNPTIKDLQTSNQAVTAALSGLLRNAPRQIKGELEHTFNNRKESSNLAMAKRVNAADLKRLTDNMAVSYSNSLETVNDYANNGESEKAFEEYQRQIENVKSSEYVIGSAKVKERTAAAKQNYDAARLWNIVKTEYYRDGQKGANKAVQAITNREIDGVSTREKLAILPMLHSRLANQIKTDGLNDKLKLQEFKIEMAENGGMLSSDRWLVAENELSELAYNSLKLDSVKSTAQNLDTTSLVNFMNENSNNSIALDSLDNKERDMAFNEIVQSELGRSPSLEDIARVAMRYDTNIPAFSKMMTSGINSNNANLAASASNIYKTLSDQNPNVARGIRKDAVDKATALNTRMLAGLNPQEAMEDYNNQVALMSKKSLSQIDTLYKQEVRDRQLNNPRNMYKFISNELDIDEEDARFSGVASDWQDLHNYSFRRGGSFDDATEFANTAIYKTYNSTSVNGNKQIMKYAPNMYYPEQEVMAQKEDSLNAVIEASEMLSKDESVPMNYKFEYTSEAEKAKRRDKGSLFLLGVEAYAFLKDKFKDETPMVNRINTITGEKEEGYAVIVSDDVTATDDVNSGKSYSWVWKPRDGGAAYRMETGVKTKEGFRVGKARFTVNTTKMKQNEEERMKRAQKQYEDNIEMYDATAWVKANFRDKRDLVRYGLLGVAKLFPKLIFRKKDRK